jgi:glucosamine-6-phosphate deaminase
MNIRILTDTVQIGDTVASIIASEIQTNPFCILGLATGSTPLDTYRALVRMYKENKVDFAKVTTFNLDEYVGLPPEHQQSFAFFMKQNLFDHVNIKTENIHLFSGTANNPKEHCVQYDALIAKAGGIDIQLLGLGNNGHIAFNEPGEKFSENSYVAELTQETIEANQRFFKSIDDVPKRAFTMGIGMILKARKIIMIASGINKAQAIFQMIKGPVTPQCPASILQTCRDITVFLDEPTASYVENKFGSLNDQITGD